MCFKCGGAWHNGRCQYSGNLAFSAWQALNPTTRCPGCRTPITKQGGCNHMKCPRCRVDWCFICRMKTPNSYGHFDSLFGCYGMQDGCGNYYFLILILMLLRLVIMPFIVYFVTMERIMKFIWKCFECCLAASDSHDEKIILMAPLTGLILMPFMIVIAVIASIPVMTW